MDAVSVGVGAGPGTFLGIRRPLRIDQPAVGAVPSVKVPSGEAWTVLFLSVQFTASAAAANRFLGLEVLDQDLNVLYQARSPLAIVASGVARLSASQRGGDTTLNASGGTVTLNLPDVPILPGYTLRGAVSGLDAGDQFGATIFEVEAATIGADGPPLGVVNFATLTPGEMEGP